MPKKSEARARLVLRYPSAFCDGRRPPAARAVDMILEDSMQTLKPFDPANTDHPRLFRELVVAAKRGAVSALERDACEWYVIRFDRYRHDPISKGHEQHGRDVQSGYTKPDEPIAVVPDDDDVDGVATHGKDESDARFARPLMTDEQRRRAEAARDRHERAAAKKAAGPPRPADGVHYSVRRPYVTMDAPVPVDFREAFSDRGDTTEHILACLAEAWLDAASVYRIVVPSGKHVVVDGHCLSRVQLHRLGALRTWRDPPGGCVGAERRPQRAPELLERADDDAGDSDAPAYDAQLDELRGLDPYDVPVVVECDENDVQRTRVAYELRNTVGEYDFAAFTLHRALCKSVGRPLSAAVLSNDTDLLWLSLAYIERCRRTEARRRCVAYAGEHDSTWSPHEPRMMLRFKPNLSWALNNWSSPATNAWSSESWLDANALRDLIARGEHRSTEEVDAADAAATAAASAAAKNKRAKTASSTAAAAANPTATTAARPRVVKHLVDQPDHRRRLRAYQERLSNKVMSLVVAMAAAGCDYCDGYPFITHDRFLTALYDDAATVGDVVVDRVDETGDRARWMDIDGAAYARLVRVAFMHGRQRVASLPRTTPVAELARCCATLADARQRMPSMRTVALRGAHIALYAKMMAQVGDRRVLEPEVLPHGYALVDVDAPLSRGNIRRVTCWADEEKRAQLYGPGK